MKDKYAQFVSLQSDLENGVNLEATIRLREEIAEQHRALGQIKEMAAKYGCDISGPATNAQEAISGPTSATWPLLSLRTVQQCPSAAYPPSWMRTSNVT